MSWPDRRRGKDWIGKGPDSGGEKRREKKKNKISLVGGEKNCFRPALAGVLGEKTKGKWGRPE